MKNLDYYLKLKKQIAMIEIELKSAENLKPIMVSNLEAEYENYCAREEMMSYGWFDDSRYW